MAWRCTSSHNIGLIDNLKAGSLIQSKVIYDAMCKVDRANYVRDRSSAYVDSPQPIGFSVTISAPHMHAMCLERLKDHLRPGMKALDVGSGSGYLVAVMALLVGNNGIAWGIEHVPQLVEWSRANVARDQPEMKNIGFLEGDGRLGLPNEAPFDAIHVGAAAEEVPPALLDQLKIGGRLIIPVGSWNQNLVQIDKIAEGNYERSTICGVRYVPLTDLNRQV